MKRIVLFLATNLAVLLVLSIVAHLLGVDTYLQAHGSSFGGLLVWAALFGFGGAFISLLMSKAQAKMSMGVRVIGQSADPTEQWLLSVVRASRPRRRASACRKSASSTRRNRTPSPPAPAATPRSWR